MSIRNKVRVSSPLRCAPSLLLPCTKRLHGPTTAGILAGTKSHRKKIVKRMIFCRKEIVTLTLIMIVPNNTNTTANNNYNNNTTCKLVVIEDFHSRTKKVRNLQFWKFRPEV